MNSERSSRGWALALLLAGGALLGGWESPPRPEASGRATPRERLFALGGAGSELLADGCWLRLNLAWERRDADAVRQWIGWAMAAAPERAYFRANAARMLAFDLPAWRAEHKRDAPAAMRTQWRTAGAEEALRLLAEARIQDAALVVEAANVALYALGDRARAAAFYRRAAELPDAPWHAGRIHAQLLRELGRDREAWEWLRAWLPRLPADDPAAQRELVVQRIAELELELRSRGEPL